MENRGLRTPGQPWTRPGFPMPKESKTALFTAAENGLKVGVVAAMCFKYGPGCEAAASEHGCPPEPGGGPHCLHVPLGNRGKLYARSRAGGFRPPDHRRRGGPLCRSPSPRPAGVGRISREDDPLQRGQLLLRGQPESGRQGYGTIYQQTFTFTDGVLQDGIDAKVIPCRLSSRKDTNDFCPDAPDRFRKVRRFSTS